MTPSYGDLAGRLDRIGTAACVVVHLVCGVVLALAGWRAFNDLPSHTQGVLVALLLFFGLMGLLGWVLASSSDRYYYLRDRIERARQALKDSSGGEGEP